MTPDRKIMVTAWSASQDPVIIEKGAPRRFFPPVVIGLIGSLLLHGLALQSVVFGSRAQTIRPPDVQEPGSSLNKPAAKPADALIFIDLPKIAKTTDGIDEALASVRAAIKDTPIPVTVPDPSPLRHVETLALSDDEDSAPSVDDGDGVERARLFGMYSGQIQARVERVWRRPRTPVNDGSDSTKGSDSVEYFQCQAQIFQDSIGNVREILLPNCNGSVAWQRSLVLAIQQASPLPAPPSPRVFSHSLTLSFIGYAYRAGSADDVYEIETASTEQAASKSPTRCPRVISNSSSNTATSSSCDLGSTFEQTTN
jgi:hypothetical protein